MSLDLFLFAEGTRYQMHGIGTAGNPYLSNPQKTEVYELLGDAGVSTDFYRIGSSFHTSVSAGLRYGNISYKDERGTGAGINAYWLNLGIEERFSWFIVGLRSDIFIKSFCRNYDNYSYLGIYPQCFSPIDIYYYFGLCSQSAKFCFELKCVFYLTPQIDPTRLAYYNLTISNITGFYLEAGISYRIFTLYRHLNLEKTSFF